jgi:hypothetical protein
MAWRSRSRSATFSLVYLRDAQTGGIHGGKHRPVLEILRSLQERFGFRFAQNGRAFLLVPRQGNPIDLDPSSQGILIEKTQRTDGLNIGRKLDPLFVEQKQLPRPDLFGAELIRRLVEVLGELGDRTDVAGNGRRRVVANAEIFQH